MSEYIIRMVGDDLIHKQVYEAAYKGDGYNFDIMFENIRNLIDEADLSIINQETILVSDYKDISSFPAFGSPSELADSIVRAGFNVVLHASNHSLDKKYKGIEDALAIWRKHKDITVLGIHDSQADAEKMRIVTVGDMKVALLNYSEKMNFHPMPFGKPYAVDRMRKRDRNKIAAQIRRAKSKADLVIVMPHWGCEYLYEPVPSQKEWAVFFADSGADLIIGTHPHVVQYKEDIRTSDGRLVPCLYSLGNFISCQIIPGTCIGGMADIRVEFDQNARIKNADIIPLMTHTDRDYSYFTTYPLEKYTRELAEENKILTVMAKRSGQKRMDPDSLNNLFIDIMEKRAMADAMFKKPMDVTISNVKGVFAALTGKNTKD